MRELAVLWLQPPPTPLPPPSPQPPSRMGEAGTLDQLLAFISTNPQIAGTYAALFSSLIALLTTLLTLRQASTSRKALEVTRRSLDEARKQGNLASASLRNSEVNARRERLNVFAPIVAPILLPDLSYLLTDHDPDVSGSFQQQFNSEKESFDEHQIVKLDRSGLNIDDLDTVWLSGELILRNDGTTTALLSPTTWFFDVIEGDDVVRVDESTFLLEPGARTRVFWLQTYSVSMWMRRAAENYRARSEHPLDPEYNYKHLGIQKDELFLTVRSPAVPYLTDYFTATYDFLPLSDDQYASRLTEGLYYFGRNMISVSLNTRVRFYPGEDQDSEHEI